MGDERKVLVATPTGFLRAMYAHYFLYEINADTIHSAFKYPILRADRPEINWDSSQFDLTVLDEILMVPKRIIDHVIASMNQIPVRSIVVMCGDRQQQLSIDGTQHAHQVNSIFQHRRFLSMVHHFNLTVQYRCDDPGFQEILNELRYHKPSQNLLNFIHDGRILTDSNDVTDAEIKLILLQHPESTVVTVTRNGTNRVNKVAVETLFEGKTPLAIVQCDCELSLIPIYKDMNVIIMQKS